ncbi:hypothetical protein [Acerihabitans arboris]
MSEKPTITLPTWMGGSQPAAIAASCAEFWGRVRDWLYWPLNQMDPLTCTVSILNLIAYQRDIDRFEGEPLALYRLRVKWAFTNAQDSGSYEGFGRIFERLGIGSIQQFERQPGVDWDVIIIRVSDGQLAANSTLMNEIVRKYGRTCRRYRFDVLNVAAVQVGASWFDNDHRLYVGEIGQDAPILTELGQYLMTEDGKILTV